MNIIDSGNYLVLHFDWAVNFSKPPLFHWILVWSLRHVRDPFWACRLPPILCSAACVVGTYAFARLIGLSRSRGLLAANLFLSCWGLFAFGRQPLLEAPLLLCLLAAFYGLARAALLDEPWWLLLFGAGLGLSGMIKWVIGPFTIAVFSAGYLNWTGHWRRLRRHPAAVAGGLLLAAAIALPYPIYLLMNYRDFRDQLVDELFIQRFSQPTSLWEYLCRSFVVDPLPWTPLLIPLLWRARRLGLETKALLLSWLAACAGPVLLIASRSDRYAFPALPALALLTAAALDPQDRRWRLALKATSVLVAVALAAVMAACSRLSLLPTAAVIAGLLLAAGACRALWSGEVEGAAAAAGMAGAGMMLSLGVAYAALGVNVVPPEVRETIGMASVVRFDNSPEAQSTAYLNLYLGRSVYILGSDNKLDAAGALPAFAVVSASSLDSFKQTAAAQKVRWEIAATWTNLHTNPRAAGLKFLRVLRSRSLEPIVVTHHLLRLSR